MDIGIVGLPNVGKSSLFNALTAAGVASENFPFTTIEPNVGVVPVNDPRLLFLRDVFQSEKVVPAPIRFVDIAGLVPGASKGEGLGNKFLAHIREVDAIAQVVRCFDDSNVISVIGDTDSRTDADIIATELLLADVEQAEKMRERLEGSARSGEESARKRIAALSILLEGLRAGVPVRSQAADPAVVRDGNFLTAKPLLIVANMGDEGSARHLEALKGWAAPGDEVVALNVKVEAEIAALPEGERAGYREAMGISMSGLDQLADAGKRLLDLITFFAAGPREAHAWHVRRGTPVAKAAGKIHTDMEKGFIRAEVYAFDDMKEAGSEVRLRAMGRMRMEGRDYVTQDGDVLYIHFKV